jgi:hypothetical protein
MFNQRRSPELGDRRLGEGSRCVGTEIAVTGVVTVREIHIKLQRNDELKDWSMEINGRLHEHVSDEGLTDLVEGALIVAAKSLIHSSGNARALQGR